MVCGTERWALNATFIAGFIHIAIVVCIIGAPRSAFSEASNQPARQIKDQWKLEENVSMASLVRDGFEIKGYSIVPQGLQAYREEEYLLQKKETVYGCYE